MGSIGILHIADSQSWVSKRSGLMSSYPWFGFLLRKVTVLKKIPRKQLGISGIPLTHLQGFKKSFTSLFIGSILLRM